MSSDGGSYCSSDESYSTPDESGEVSSGQSVLSLFNPPPPSPLLVTKLGFSPHIHTADGHLAVCEARLGPDNTWR